MKFRFPSAKISKLKESIQKRLKFREEVVVECTDESTTIRNNLAAAFRSRNYMSRQGGRSLALQKYRMEMQNKEAKSI